MDGCCGLVRGYASKVVDAAEDCCSLASELLCDEAGDILAVSCRPMKMNREIYVSVVGPLEAEANQGQVTMVQGKLPVGPSHVY